MKNKIVLDSSGDLLVLDGVDFANVPLKIMTDSREFVDDASTDIAEMVGYLKEYKGKTTSACPAVGDYLAAFGEADNVYCVTITSGLSGSYNSASIAAETYREQHPDCNVHVFDSLSAGPELALLAEKLRDLISEGHPFASIVEKLKEYQQKTRLMFSLESLHNLAANGRVSNVIAKAIGILGIRLIGVASEDGVLQPTSKARGEARVIPELVKALLASGYKGGKMRIDHCLNEVGAKGLRQAILDRFPSAQVVIGTTGALCSFYAEEGGMLIGYEA